MDDPPIARNAPCPCGSGKRYKHCHGQPGNRTNDSATSQSADPGDGQTTTPLFHRPTTKASGSASFAELRRDGFDAADQGQYTRAEQILKQALIALEAEWPAAEQPDLRAGLEKTLLPKQIHRQYGQILDKLGFVLRQVGRYRESLQCLEREACLLPDSAPILVNLGTVLSDLGQSNEAIQRYQSALKLDPALPHAHYNLGLQFLKMGHAEEAVTSLGAAVRLAPDWLEPNTSLLSAVNYVPDLEPEQRFRHYRQFNERFCRPLRDRWPRHTNPPDPDRKLRIGYVSPDFRSHPVAQYVDHLIRNHDRNGFDIYCYYTGESVDQRTQEIREHSDFWRECHRLSDEAMFHAIIDDRIDILFDLAVHTAMNRIGVFVRKPAPIQFTSIGMPVTTGIEAMDYRVTNQHAEIRTDLLCYYTEQLIRIPGWPVYEPDAVDVEVGPLPALRNGYVTFASFNSLSKVNASVLGTWATILSNVPESRLMIMNVSDPITRDRVTAFFRSRGVESYRVDIRSRLSLSEYIALHNDVDIGLDTFPYNGGTTTRIGLWMGIPFVTLRGDLECAQVGSWLLRDLGMDRLIARETDAYVHIATELAFDLTTLQLLRGELRNRCETAAFMDQKRCVRTLEHSYRDIWMNWCRATAHS